MNTCKSRRISFFFVVAAVFAFAFTANAAVRSAGAEEAIQKKNLVILGDSIAAGHGVAASAESFGALIANVMDFNYVNDAQGGARSDDMLNRVKGLKTRQDKAETDSAGVPLDITSADYIMISIGGNDFQADASKMGQIIGEIAASAFTAFDALAVEVLGRITDSIDEIRALNPDAYIFMLNNYGIQMGKYGATPIASMGGLTGTQLQSIMNAAFSRYNPMLVSALSDYTNLEVIDMYSVMNDKAALFISTETSPVHPNAAGHQVIANISLKTIVAVCAEQRYAEGKTDGYTEGFAAGKDENNGGCAAGINTASVIMLALAAIVITVKRPA